MKKILITGANGLLGQKLISHLEGHPAFETLATGKTKSRRAETPGTYHQMDITKPEEVSRVFEQTKPDIVINTAAMTQVDQCETDQKACWELNVTAVSHLIESARHQGSFLIHLSTDFIFDGAQGPYKETDTPNPISHYGQSKWASEKMLMESDISWAIVRTQLVYGIVPHLQRSNIILWVKKNLEEGKPIKVVNDQWRTPTLAEDLARGCVQVAEKEAEGIFHLSGSELLTPYDMAMATAQYFGLDASLIEEVDASLFTQPAKRPPKTGFILDKARSVLGFQPSSFNSGLALLKSQLHEP